MELNQTRKEDNRLTEEYIQQTEIQKYREKERRYPYIVIHMYPSVFKQLPIVFVPDDTVKPSQSEMTIINPHPYISGKLTDEARNIVIEIISHIVKTGPLTGSRGACVVFSEDDCVYCEKDGAQKNSNTPPSGGLNWEALNTTLQKPEDTTELRYGGY